VLYAKEILALVGDPTYSGRRWKMKEIVSHVARGRPSTKQERERYRKGVRRVMEALIDSGHVIRQPARPGATPLYIWKAGHEVMQKRDELRDNDAGDIAP